MNKTQILKLVRNKKLPEYTVITALAGGRRKTYLKCNKCLSVFQITDSSFFKMLMHKCNKVK